MNAPVGLFGLGLIGMALAGRMRSAGVRVVGHDPESDIAVIKVDKAGLPPVEFGDSDAIAVGDPVLAIGSPYGLESTVTAGVSRS